MGKRGLLLSNDVNSAGLPGRIMSLQYSFQSQPLRCSIDKPTAILTLNGLPHGCSRQQRAVLHHAAIHAIKSASSTTNSTCLDQAGYSLNFCKRPPADPPKHGPDQSDCSKLVLRSRRLCFAQLPTGLRLQIWEHVFPGGEYIPIKSSRGKTSILRRFDVCGKQSVTFEMADTDLLVDRKAWGRHGRALLRRGYQLKTLRPVGRIFKHGDPAMLLYLALTCRTVYGHSAP